MADPTVDVALSTLSGLYSNLQALLKEMNSKSASQKGMLRWSLQKKLESDPSCSISLLGLLVKELEKTLKGVSEIYKTQSHMHVIPVLHTLYYVVIQSGVNIPISLYQKVYECLMKLLILPSPYSTVVLSTLRSIKMEMVTPGSSYQRRVIAEQNLKSEHFTLQEKVFVLADPAVFSVTLEATVRAHLEAPNSLRNTVTMEKNVVLHVLERGLGMMIQSSRLAQALEASEDHMVEKYFQEVVLAVEESIKHGAGGSANYLVKLHDIHKDIMTASKGEVTTVDHGAACGTPLPFPEISFVLWRNDEDLWTLLSKFALHGSRNSSAEDTKDKRNSVRPEDGGTETELKQRHFADTKAPLKNTMTALNRRKAFKSITAVDKLTLIQDKMEAFPGSAPVLKEDKKRLTARVVVMGDDRVLGRLTRAYHSIRERESKRLVLTKKLNLHLYYIPVTDLSLSPPDTPRQEEGRLSLAYLLGRLDPWYNSNINSLPTAIAKLSGTSSHSNPSQQNLFLLDTLCYYIRCATQPVNLPLYSVKMTCSSCDVTSVVEDVFVSHLEADIPEFRHLKERPSERESSNRRRKQSVGVIGAVISVSYTKMSLSKREVVKGEAPMTCGVVMTSEPAAVTSGEDCLTVRFDSVNPGYNTLIQTQNISIRTMECRTLSVCLDKDSRRTYTDVQRIEVSPCLDPGCSVRSRFGISSERELPLYLDKVLSLPINTFTGVIP